MSTFLTEPQFPERRPEGRPPLPMPPEPDAPGLALARLAAEDIKARLAGASPQEARSARRLLISWLKAS